jgi:hypothetical protein
MDLFYVFISDISTACEIFHLEYLHQKWTCPAGGVTTQKPLNGIMAAVIAPVGAISVKLRFTSFRMNPDNNIVTVKSCASIDCIQSSVLGQYTGVIIPSPVSSNTGVMLIEWESHSDYQFDRPWFSAKWSSDILGGESFFSFWSPHSFPYLTP